MSDILHAQPSRQSSGYHSKPQLMTAEAKHMTYQMARVLLPCRKAAIFAKYTNQPLQPFLRMKAQPTFVGLGHSHNYYLPERVAFCLMFTYRDADVILKMEPIFKRGSKSREGNKQLLSHFPQSETGRSSFEPHIWQEPILWPLP